MCSSSDSPNLILWLLLPARDSGELGISHRACSRWAENGDPPNAHHNNSPHSLPFPGLASDHGNFLFAVTCVNEYFLGIKLQACRVFFFFLLFHFFSAQTVTTSHWALPADPRMSHVPCPWMAWSTLGCCRHWGSPFPNVILPGAPRSPPSLATN